MPGLHSYQSFQSPHVSSGSGGDVISLEALFSYRLSHRSAILLRDVSSLLPPPCFFSICNDVKKLHKCCQNYWKSINDWTISVFQFNVLKLSQRTKFCAILASTKLINQKPFPCQLNWKWRHLVFVLSVNLWPLQKKPFNFGHNFWTIRERDFIFHVHTQLMKPFKITPRSMTLWPWPWLLY